jgi:hypothetical protein
MLMIFCAEAMAALLSLPESRSMFATCCTYCPRIFSEAESVLV